MFICIFSFVCIFILLHSNDFYIYPFSKQIIKEKGYLGIKNNTLNLSPWYRKSENIEAKTVSINLNILHNKLA